MKHTYEELAWLLVWFEEHKRKMPSSRRFEPYYNASSWDLDDLFRAFREDAVGNRQAVWDAVWERSKLGKWPKIHSSTAFWLKERWEMAESFCRYLLQTRNASLPPVLAAQPTNPEASIKWLLLDMWDTSLVDAWIRERAREFVFADDGHCEGSEAELERYLNKLEQA
jgi:hypothetical protein